MRQVTVERVAQRSGVPLFDEATKPKHNSGRLDLLVRMSLTSLSARYPNEKILFTRSCVEEYATKYATENERRLPRPVTAESQRGSKNKGAIQ